MKRLCIYLTYDRQRIVDDYIAVMLKELKSCVEYLAVVCNEEEIIHGEDILRKYADSIFFRKNIGFDAGGLKDALSCFLGWDKILQYDELVLVNDSMFGPFRPMRDIFSEMDRKPADFWGLLKHAESKNRVIGYIPEHIQSFFLVIRSKMLHSSEFQEYWKKMPYYCSFHDTVIRHEIVFTQYFAGLGYTYETLADTMANDAADISNNFSQYATLSYELIKKRNFPFLKKKQIAITSLSCQTQENLCRAIEYIDKETDYDVNLIWENIIRTFNMADLQRSLHLQYIISEEQKEENIENAVIAVFVEYQNSVEYILEYIEELRQRYIIKIYSRYQECLSEYQKLGFEYRKIRTDNILPVFAELSNFKFVCILHDADMSSDVRPSYIGKSYFYNIWENMAKNCIYIRGILKLFIQKSRLGFLAPPQPNFGEYYKEYAKGWGRKFEAVQRIARGMNLNCQISEYIPPYRIADCFWIRGHILKKLKALDSEDESYLPYLWSYIVQDAGYYSGIVESTEYASMNEVNMQYYLCQIASQVKRGYADFDDFYDMKAKMFHTALGYFCMKYPRLLVYGAGELAKQFSGFMTDIEAYVVSDGQEKPEELEGKPVKYLSEIIVTDTCGFVLCLNERNQRQVIPLLEKQGIEHYFCI